MAPIIFMSHCRAASGSGVPVEGVGALGVPARPRASAEGKASGVPAREAVPAPGTLAAVAGVPAVEAVPSAIAVAVAVPGVQAAEAAVAGAIAAAEPILRSEETPSTASLPARLSTKRGPGPSART